MVSPCRSGKQNRIRRRRWPCWCCTSTESRSTTCPRSACCATCTCTPTETSDEHHVPGHLRRPRPGRPVLLLGRGAQVRPPRSPGPPDPRGSGVDVPERSEEHTSELQSRGHLVCRLLLEKKK